ncbi:diguanylate cyclase [Pseudoalteromonas porphyrae]|uniref:GGDEF domain-containing protein n=1 Tax=Pseudoalteromonas TaxID=53246 RepID=UPI0006BAA805|nr:MULTISPECIES: GGDEF domain-containing protein [Pseudoalteromonas]KPH95827.1 diguanylate cyclase [Pseudoalteromonas porphyrae]NNG41550.1 GGDEF domain-containing protein [Pseudoalteromonas sp. NEC-BIFX-2020_002]
MPEQNTSQPSWLKLINIESVYSAEKQRRAFTFFTMISIALVLVTTLVVLNYHIYAKPLTVMLVVSDITFLVCAIYFMRTGHLNAVAALVLGIICMLCVALVYTGGKENTALYWLMFYPVVAFSTLGLRIGLIGVSVLLCVSCFLLYGPDIGQVKYGYAEKVRFSASFILVFLFTFIGEYFRNKSHMEIAHMTLLQKQDAHTDQLTGLANRRFITSHFLPLAKSRPEQYFPFTVLLMDLDNFKYINDSFGHDFGDHVLIEFSTFLESQLRSSDIKVRYGGEEFMVILPRIDSDAAFYVADKFREYISTQTIMFTQTQKTTITCSIGVVQVNKISEFNQAVKRADECLYDAKHAGRNCVMSGELA